MEVIIDTNVIIDAVFDQPNNEDCWQILTLLRNRYIYPIVSQDLLCEYFFIPLKLGLKKLNAKNEKGELSISDFAALNNTLHDIINDLMKVIFGSKHRLVTVVSKQKICVDSSDDKILNLAIDSNCHIIITKNYSDFRPAMDQDVKTKNGKVIEIYTPEKFLDIFRLISKYNCNRG